LEGKGGGEPVFLKTMSETANLHHNLIQQLSELMDSVWRYENFYVKDAEGCSRCQALWEKLKERHYEDIKALKEEISAHVAEGDW
jgi:hypothetical protein